VRTRHVRNTSAANGDLLIMFQPGQTRGTSDPSRSGPVEKSQGSVILRSLSRNAIPTGRGTFAA
jgi:hypothetical protein